MIDRTTKAVLVAIALGLWMNVGSQWLRPTPVFAQSEEIRDTVNEIRRTLNAVANGVCVNAKIC
jgi:hypothetical protein